MFLMLLVFISNTYIIYNIILIGNIDAMLQGRRQGSFR